LSTVSTKSINARWCISWTQSCVHQSIFEAPYRAKYAVTRRIEMSSNSLKRWLSTSEQCAFTACTSASHVKSACIQRNTNSIKRGYIYRIRQPVNVQPWSSKVGFAPFFFCARKFLLFLWSSCDSSYREGFSSNQRSTWVHRGWRVDQWDARVRSEWLRRGEGAKKEAVLQ